MSDQLAFLFPNAADGRAGDESADESYQARMKEIMSREDLWRDDFEIAAHWVPQFIFIGMWLRDGRP